MLKPLKRQKLYEDIVEQITYLIKTDQLKEGDKIPSERILAEELNVSRPTVREALRTLESMGHIESKIGGGMYVRSLSFNYLLGPMSEILSKNDKLVEDILEMRFLLEIETVKLAAQRRKPEHLKQMEEVLSQMKHDIDKGGNGIIEDKNFHIKIAEATGNTAICMVFTMFRGLLMKVIESVFEKKNEPMSAYTEHKIILDAIIAGASEDAGRAMQKHLQRTAERIRGVL